MRDYVRHLHHHLRQLPYIYLGIVETIALGLCVYLGYWLHDRALPQGEMLPRAAIFALIMVLAMISMGVYQSRLREGFAGMMLRTAVAFFLIAALALAVIFYIVPDLSLARGTLATSIVASYVAVTSMRWGASRLIDDEDFKTRVLVLGTGKKAMKIATRLRRKSDRRGFAIHGYVRLAGTPDLIGEHGANILDLQEPLPVYCQRHDIAEIVVAPDERRRTGDGPSPLPIDELLDCRLSGINVVDVLSFFEREVGKILIDMLQPSWMIFSDGFAVSGVRNASERVFDVVAASMLLLVAWPVMLGAVIAVKLESGWRAPVVYRQQRVGLNGKNFSVIKFRSMQVNAEQDGKAVWAQQNDPRVTTVGQVMRRSRIDELPQIFNVLRGDMSFVGPRPERPEFVHELAQTIPYYNERHRVKPGITGWAQLCYPYGASDADALEKLQYDIYYLKNHSVLLDLLILIQTVEVILIGDGAR